MGGTAGRPKLLTVVAVVATLTMAGPAAAQYDEALFAFNRGDFATAARQFEEVAREGDPDAQYWLGRIYEGGLGRPRDPVTAYGWFERAAESGHQDAATLRDRMAARLTQEQLAEARRRSAPGNAAKDREARDLIAAIQRELNRLGYRTGVPDGIAGNRTRTAIERFQREVGLDVTGMATDRLLDRLRVSGK